MVWAICPLSSALTFAVRAAIVDLLQKHNTQVDHVNMMVAGGVAFSADEGRSRRLDLKRSLMVSVVAVATFCFLATSMIAVSMTYRSQWLKNAQVADTIGRELEAQIFRIKTMGEVASRFPDWERLGNFAQGPGQCVTVLRSDNSVARSSCAGSDLSAKSAPAWFALLLPSVLLQRTDVDRPLVFNDEVHGSLNVSTLPEVIVEQIWQGVRDLLMLALMMTIAICALLYFAIGRALRPTKEVLSGLARLAEGDLSCRLPRFRLVELDQIGLYFNQMAGALDRSQQERARLASRLVNVQEEGRRDLARDLHDELAQSLSALAAIASSVRISAEAEQPGLAAKAKQLADLAGSAMRSLRVTLRNLRPPEIDDLGLSGSLSALIAEHEQRSKLRTKIDLEIAGDVGRLTATQASHVYRIVQEGLSNIAKHSNATHARVSIGIEAGDDRFSAGKQLRLFIEDNGQCANGRSNEVSQGYGLMGMRERVMALGGQIDTRHGSPNGFQVDVTVPLEISGELPA